MFNLPQETWKVARVIDRFIKCKCTLQSLRNAFKKENKCGVSIVLQKTNPSGRKKKMETYET